LALFEGVVLEWEETIEGNFEEACHAESSFSKYLAFEVKQIPAKMIST